MRLNACIYGESKILIVKELSHQTVGGAEESRTPDLLRAKQMLYQLSYGPTQIRDRYDRA